MTTPVNHDALYKALLSAYIFEFIELFVPDLAGRVQRGRIEWLNTEAVAQEAGIPLQRGDLVAKIWLLDGSEAFVILHIEIQSWADPEIRRRMFFYFIHLLRRYRAPVYPILLATFADPLRPEPSEFHLDVAGRRVVSFWYHVVQLNRLEWRRYLRRREPLALALLARMGVQPQERVKVKLWCLRRLARLSLDREQTSLLWTFVETYLPLEAAEQVAFREAVEQLPRMKKEKTMQWPNQWIEEGMAQGVAQGMARGQAQFALRLLRRKFGDLPADLVAAIEALPADRLGDLAEALLDFHTIEDAREWVEGHAVA
jgi:hypothetical protein